MSEKYNTRRKKWVKALRSGKYKQGFGRLQYGNKYCALGLAYKIIPWKYKFKYWSIGSIRFWAIEDYYNIDQNFIDDIIAHNDIYSTNFNKIADVIEKELNVT